MLGNDIVDLRDPDARGPPRKRPTNSQGSLIQILCSHRGNLSPTTRAISKTSTLVLTRSAPSADASDEASLNCPAPFRRESGCWSCEALKPSSGFMSSPCRSVRIGVKSSWLSRRSISCRMIRVRPFARWRSVRSAAFLASWKNDSRSVARVEFPLSNSTGSERRCRFHFPIMEIGSPTR